MTDINNLDNDRKSKKSRKKEQPLINLALTSLNQPEDEVLRNWLKIVYPKILDHLSLKQAKGVSQNIAEHLAREINPENKKSD